MKKTLPLLLLLSSLLPAISPAASEISESQAEKLKENIEKLGGSGEAITQALCFYEKNLNTKFKKKVKSKFTDDIQIKNHQYILVQDFTLPSAVHRLFLVNLKTNEIQGFYSAHGSGNLESVYNYPMWAEHFSNTYGSNLTPRGFLLTGERNKSQMGWRWVVRLDGLEKGLNDNSRDRAIVFHPGVGSKNWNDERVRSGMSSSNENSPITDDDKGFQYMSNGCTMVSKHHAEYIYEKIAEPTLLYNFTSAEKELGETYCGQ